MRILVFGLNSKIKKTIVYNSRSQFEKMNSSMNSIQNYSFGLRVAICKAGCHTEGIKMSVFKKYTKITCV